MTQSIVVEHLSKQYEIGQLQHATMLREAIVDLIKFPFRRTRAPRETIWALNDVSFAVEAGEVLGIIGRNGSGKSTLLKILSRITRPTVGTIHVTGHVAALLEVGTGFHEELTGRENIFLCGSTLGMTRKRIAAKLDAIIEFSGVEKFIDTPIKRYSSGMRLRLGFAVAANLEANVLLVDEVLAVGDADFQKKCLQAMSELHGGGRTALFVSHNLAAIENLCSRAIWIDGGQLRLDGSPKEVIAAYMASFATMQDKGLDLRRIESRRGSGDIRFSQIEILDAERRTGVVVRSGDRIVLRLHYEARKQVESPIFGIEISTQLGTLVAQIHTYNSGVEIPFLSVGEGYIDVEIAELNLMPGRYSLSLFAANLGYLYHDVLQHCATLDVEVSTRYGFARGLQGNPIMLFACTWEVGPSIRVRAPLDEPRNNAQSANG
jgi:lipopolysaccharide transport system ATP-binding protein